ncbi:MAG: RagB/SusD family nutrient uptake outer membrane protein [Bacteroidota bacterium]
MKKIHLIIIVLLALMAGTSCNSDLINIDNPNQATTESFWKTPDDAIAGINACYSSLYKEGTWMRWLSFRYDLTSDEGWSSSPWNELANWTNFNYANYNFYEGNRVHMEHFYRGIFRTNQVLKFVPDITFTTNQSRKESIMGEAKFLRALWYFQVVLLWEKGSLVTEPVDAGYTPVESGSAEFYAQIEKDLKEAVTVLPEKWTGADVGRATQGAARALLGKVYMQQKKYAEAKTELQWLVSKEGSLYGLVPNWVDNFTHLNENNIEGIFEIQFNDANKGNTGNNASMATGFQRTQFYAPGGIGWGDGKARDWLIGEYKKERRLDGNNDIRLYHSIFYEGFLDDFPSGDPMYYYIDSRTAWVPRGWRGSSFIRKYNTSYFRQREDYFAPNNYRIMRYADILLNFAECIIKTGGTPAEAVVHVNKVRQRVNLAKLEDSIFKDAMNTPDAFMKRLQMERALELCFEGWRWADLKRWGLLETQAGIDELKSRDPDFNNFVIGKHIRLPLPQLEIDNSMGGLTQNPLY